MISAEDFAIWRAQPITEAVFKYIEARRDDAKGRWLSISWEIGDPEPKVLWEARGVAAMAIDILELKADDLNEEDDERRAQT